MIKEMLNRINMFAYGEVAYENDNWQSDSGLSKTLEEIEHPRLMTAILHDKEDVYPALKKFLGKEMGKEEEKEEEPS